MHSWQSSGTLPCPRPLRNHDGIHPCDEPGHEGSRPDLIGQQCLYAQRPVQLDVALHDHALQIYQWADDHNRDFYSLAATGIIVLLVVLLIFNSIAVFVRQPL